MKTVRKSTEFTFGRLCPRKEEIKEKTQKETKMKLRLSALKAHWANRDTKQNLEAAKSGKNLGFPIVLATVKEREIVRSYFDWKTMRFPNGSAYRKQVPLSSEFIVVNHSGWTVVTSIGAFFVSRDEVPIGTGANFGVYYNSRDLVLADLHFPIEESRKRRAIGLTRDYSTYYRRFAG